MAEKPDYIIQAAARCLQVLRLFDSQHREMTLTELSERSGLTKSSCLRVLETLRSEDFVEYEPSTKHFRLGLEILRLSINAYNFSDLRDLAHRYLQSFASEYGVLAQVGVIDRDDVVIIAREYPDTIAERMNVVAPMGQGIPLHCTGLGKVLMAYADPQVREACLKKCRFERYQPNTITTREAFDRVLEQIRRQGYCVTDREHEAAIICMTFPIFDHRNQVVAAFSGTGWASSMTPEVRASMRVRMTALSELLSRNLGRE